MVGHYEAGSTKKTQADLHRPIEVAYPGQTRLLQFMVQPGTELTGETEDSTRSRSFLFLALGALVASDLETSPRLVIPENGFIALNAPMTRTRLGPLSTRTAHPHSLHLFRQILGELGLPVVVEAPYAFTTKGEMVTQCRDAVLLHALALRSMSCAHPRSGRWREGVAYKHCGRCVPCIIRRASMRPGNLDSASDYRQDVLGAAANGRNLEDVRAFLTAIVRANREAPIHALLRAGPLSDSPEHLHEYVGVYQRGLTEVATFLNGRATHRL